MKEYFSHDYHARADEKIIKMLRSMGPGGYGIYWMIIEMLYESNGTVTKDYELIAYDLRVQVECVKMVCEDFDLFVISESAISSDSVARRIQERELRTNKAILAGRMGGLAKHKSSKILADARQSLEQEPSRILALKESKGKERKEGSGAFAPPTLLEVVAYCKERGNSVNPEKWFAHYQSNGWKVGKNSLKDWRAAVRTWEHSQYDIKTQPGGNVTPCGGLMVNPAEAHLREMERTIRDNAFHDTHTKGNKCAFCGKALEQHGICDCAKYKQELRKVREAV